MTAKRIYMDYNASAPLLSVAREAILDACDFNANPSSVHASGRRARQKMEAARRDVALLCGTSSENVIFTSGASEAAATLLNPNYQMGKGRVKFSHLYCASTDHPCILEGGQFEKQCITHLPVDQNGILDLNILDEQLSAHDDAHGLAMVAIHWVNNESGIIQPIETIKSIVSKYGAVLVVDGVQGAGRLDITELFQHVDFLILSSHKMGGPRGSGAIVAKSTLFMPQPLIRGGGQERGFRGGTQNDIAICGFGSAAKVALANLENYGNDVKVLKDFLEEQLLKIAPTAIIHGCLVPRVANTTYFSIPGLKCETAQIAFDLAGISLSSGSACSSGKIGKSHVLSAMGYSDENGALRVSIGCDTLRDDIESFLQVLKDLVTKTLKTGTI